MNKSKVVLGMSGGVDSLTSAILLQEQGYTVIGVTLLLWDDASSAQAIVDAKSLADKLNIEHHVVDVRPKFKSEIISYFIDEYLSGRTPFPCVKCNNTVKWDQLLQFADKHDAYWVACGHYAKKLFYDGRYSIEASKDPEKDQSFFLWGLNQVLLERIIFPMSDFTKDQTRDKAQKNNFQSTSDRKESTGACFCSDGNYRKFLEDNVDNLDQYAKRGNFVSTKGKILGFHQGIPFYTVGQRRGLGVIAPKPMYVQSLDIDKNTIVLGEHSTLFEDEFYLKDYNLYHPTQVLNKEVTIRVRYRKQSARGVISKKGDLLHVRLIEPEYAIAPGQTAVFYNDDEVLGGGFIL